MEALKAVRDQLLKANEDQVRVIPNTEFSYLGHPLSPEATAMRSQMLVCGHSVMGRGHQVLHTSENGDKEFRPNCEGDADRIKLTDEIGKEIFVFMPRARATAPAAPAPSPDPISPQGEVSTNTDAQTGVRTYKLQRAMEEGEGYEGEGLDRQAEAELYALAVDAEREDAARDQRRLDQIIANLEPSEPDRKGTRWETKAKTDGRIKGRMVRRGEMVRTNSTAYMQAPTPAGPTVAAADLDAACLPQQTTGHTLMLRQQ